MAEKFFVTTALPYANGVFHIGHIMEYIKADIWVRFQRMQGNQVHFVGADDAHGAPIMLKAEAEGISPQQLVARIAAGRPKYLQGFHLSFDHWHSTDSPENVALSQDIYRRLKAAGLFYKVLNTPERIDIIEATGHLEPADAQFLLDAATFYRAVDHALRVYSGHAEASLPHSESHLRALTELVHRWTPEHRKGQPLKAELVKIQNRTREIFERLFAN